MIFLAGLMGYGSPAHGAGPRQGRTFVRRWSVGGGGVAGTGLGHHGRVEIGVAGVGVGPSGWSPQVVTPFGPVVLHCGLGDRVAGLPDEVAQPNGQGWTAGWCWPETAQLRLTAAPIAPPLDDHFELLDGYWGVVWSIQALDALESVTVSAVLAALPDDAVGGADSGELLAAVTYETADLTLSIGGHDEEALHGRASHDAPCWGGPLPRRWAPQLWPLWQTPFGVDLHHQHGLVCRLPGLDPGERVDLHVSIAWGARRDDAATWYAVDTTPERILSQTSPAT